MGWPSSEQIKREASYDARGSRIVPAFPDPWKHKALISFYGDSFTWGAEVDNADAWGNLLSGKIGARVANYGVGGYSSEQALLRFLQKTDDEAEIVFLNHLSENILRNVNQYRQLLYPGNGLGFKPRFIIDQNNQLKLIALPTFSEAEYQDVVYDPESYLPYEYFIPDGPSGVQNLSFPIPGRHLSALVTFM